MTPKIDPPSPDERIEGLLPLRPVEFQILLGLSGGARHGYGIILDAEERTGGALRLDVATLYRALRRLEGEGLLREVPAPADEDDERRRYYDLTVLGRGAARAEARRLAGLVRAARDADLLDGVEPA